MAQVEIYKMGLFCCSVCAPVDMPQDAVEKEVNEQNPSGTTRGWFISSDATFVTGQPMPCPCEKDPTRQHWLLNC